MESTDKGAIFGAMNKTEVAVIGGGIVGLAFAFAHARKGRAVTVFERTDFAVGASVRNFGLIWPVGQSFGMAHDRAIRSREIWLQVIHAAGLWHAPGGSMHLAYKEDEVAVLEEYLEGACSEETGRELLSGREVLKRCSAQPTGLRGGLWSATEINIDPRQAVRALPEFLAREFGVSFQFGVNVHEVSAGKLRTSVGPWIAKEVVVCSGGDFETLYPDLFRGSGMTRSKLQMMRTAPQKWALGTTLCGGLTLTHYDSFQACRSLPRLIDRFRRELPFEMENGIHVLLSQTALGELTIGDSHHYGLTLEPWDREEINAAILRYLKGFAKLPSYEIAERWNGTYPKLPGRTEFIAKPEDNVLVATGLGGAGMTMSFGLADEIVSGKYWDAHHGREKVLT